MVGRELALPVLAFLDLPAAALVEVAAGAGFDSVTLRVAGSSEPMPADITGPRRLRETLAALRATGLGVLDVEVLRLGPDLTSDEISRAVDLAAELGARHLLVIDSAWGDPAALTDQLGIVQERATCVGVRVCLEFMAFSACRDFQSALAAAVPAGAAVLVDLLHLHRSGGGPQAVADAVADHGPSVFPYAQLCDAPLAAPRSDGLRAEAVADRRLPGEGGLPVAADLAALPDGIPLSVEAPTRAMPGLVPRDRAVMTMRATRRLLGVDRV